ncbi:hyaluronoglucosaminidase [Pullulanibacillus pueri]|uniref:GH84 domain-containing protein n=1 Tax=Pullulanibacillus pueri TaxID=1437324 RepID=A0A8J2ZXP9_9BACL|nr:protein O-GlcNAcase [Pullulanibacillus pueri]MBM7682915.1 hyaluronoglucosaminidase [Pullulanibacillus pueri]GGH84800.1 hypothetical protein GCM10007096_28720 [Pullulanibacillus pueri]
MSHSPFQVRGVIEGFYGLFYTAPERNDLISFIGKHGYNLYIYGPKNDRQHRARWREPYPEEIMDEFAQTVSLSKQVGVEFCYSIGSGVSMNYASEQDMNVIKTKFKSFYDIGVRTFVILLDDIASEFRFEEEKQRFRSYGEAHVEVTNHLYDWLKALDVSCHLMLCPTHYHGQAPFDDYIHELGQGVYQDIDIFYTGPEICSPEISEKHALDFSKAVQRKPMIWDNYPVNDLGMTGEMHIGPIHGRAAGLPHVSQGFVVNTMSQAEASKIPLLTFKDYFAKPEAYEPWQSWERALETIGGQKHLEALKRFAENALESCLEYGIEDRLERLTSSALQAMKSGEKPSESAAVQALFEYFDQLDEAGYELKFRMKNYALRNNLYPWIELMESAAWAGRRAIQLLKVIEKQEDPTSILKWLKESVREVEEHPKSIMKKHLFPLTDYALSMVKEITGTV